MSAASSRRAILAGSAAAVLAPVVAPIGTASAAPAVAPDSRLLELRIAVLDATAAHEAAVMRFNRADAAELHDEAVDAAWDAREAALFAMAEIPAVSIAGFAAKAAFAHQIICDGASDAERELMRSLAADAAVVLGGAPPAPAAASPDAELVAACGDYAAAGQRINEAREDVGDGHPLWVAYRAARDRAEAAPAARTLAGVRAMAELCRAMSQPLDGGRLDFSDSYCGEWPGRVVEDVLRLVGQPG